MIRAGTDVALGATVGGCSIACGGAEDRLVFCLPTLGVLIHRRMPHDRPTAFVDDLLDPAHSLRRQEHVAAHGAYFSGNVLNDSDFPAETNGVIHSTLFVRSRTVPDAARAKIRRSGHRFLSVGDFHLGMIGSYTVMTIKTVPLVVYTTCMEAAVADDKPDNPVYRAAASSVIKAVDPGSIETYLLDALEEVRTEMRALRRGRYLTRESNITPFLFPQVHVTLDSSDAVLPKVEKLLGIRSRDGEVTRRSLPDDAVEFQTRVARSDIDALAADLEDMGVGGKRVSIVGVSSVDA